LPGGCQTLAKTGLGAYQKKVNEDELTLTIWDESGFSFVPDRNHTWAPVGETPVLYETPGRHNHTGLGFILRTPKRSLVKFCFTIYKGAVTFDDFVFHLTDLHHYCRNKVVVLWDHLPTHHAVETYFMETRPDWFVFEYFPAYSPELNPVEPCWNHMKNVILPNFVPITDAELVENVHKSAMKINEKRLLHQFFKQAKLKL
jgi:transposase